MDPGRGALLFLHIAGGAAWLGASVFANLVLVPQLSRLPMDRRRELVGSLILGPERLIIGAALAAAVTGLALGLGYSDLRSVAALTTPYGLVWLASIFVVVGVFAIGGRVTSPAARALRDDASLWGPGPAEAARRDPLVDRLRLGFRLELSGILLVLGLMVVLAGI